MKTSLLLLLHGAVIVYAATYPVIQDVDESFQGSDYSFANPQACLEYYNCSVKPLPIPGDGLKWENLISFRVPQRAPANDIGLVPIDTDLGHDYYYAKWVNTSKPAFITKNYHGSHVNSWELHGLDFGCSAVQSMQIGPGSTDTEVGYANCSLSIVGFLKGKRVGSEIFHSVGRWDGFTNPVQFHMDRFTTTDGGLKSKNVTEVKLTGKYEGGPGNFVGDLVLGIDEVKYTLYNGSAEN